MRCNGIAKRSNDRQSNGKAVISKERQRKSMALTRIDLLWNGKGMAMEWNRAVQPGRAMNSKGKEKTNNNKTKENRNNEEH